VFFGNTYSTFNVSTNGFISFGNSFSNGCCAGRTIPSNDGINNLIAAAWTDLYIPPGPVSLTYEMRGRAPTRYLVVSFENIPWCCGGTTGAVTTQIILYEGTNTIEIHTTSQSAGHIYTQGVENADGTQAAFLPGRVAANYGLANDAVRFTTNNSGSWLTRASLPTPRRGLAVWGANGLIYAIGGANGAGTVVPTVQAYNPSTNSWSNKAPLPSSRQTGNGAVAINNIVYLAGGHDAGGAITRTLYAYNTGTNTWSTRAQMPVFSSCGGSAVIQSKLYVFSGCTRSGTGAQIPAGFLDRYDPATNTWTALHTAPVSHFQPVVGAVAGKLYVVGGTDAANTVTGRVDMYDPATNTWSTRASMPTPRVGAAGNAVPGKLEVIGGRSGTTYYGTVEAYNPVSNTWSTQSSMPTTRAALGVGGLNGFLYAIGGRNGAGVLGTNERFTF
jgi:N-acetylneuraminic acid mutarotase